MTQTDLYVLSVTRRYASSFPSCFLKRFFTLVIILTLFLSLAFTNGSFARGSWTQWRGSVEHIGTSTESPPEEVELLWKYQTDGKIWSSPVFYEDCVLIGSNDGRLYCLDMGNGKELWKFKTNNSVQSTPLVIDDMVYFGSLDGNFYCLDMPDVGSSSEEPQELWRYDCSSSIISSAHNHDNSLLFGSSDGWLYSLSLQGDFNWRIKIGNEIQASPLIDEANSRAYIGTTNGNYSCVDLSDGSLNWTIDAGEVYSSGCLYNGIIYLGGGDDERIYAIDTESGSIIWSFFTEWAVYSTPAISEGRIYFGSYEYAWCLPAEDPNDDGEINSSELIWSTQTHDYQGGSSPVVTEEYVLIGSDDRNMYCLDKETGDVIWNFTTENFIYSSPAMYNGAIYFGSCDRYMYCIGRLIEGLRVDLELEIDEIMSNETLQINITVVDQNGTVEGASLEIVLSGGEFEVISAGEGEGILTDENGRVELLITPPPVSSRSSVDIKVTVRKAGVTPGESTISIIVTPGDEENGQSTSGLIDPNEKRLPFIILLIIFLAVDIILGVGIVIMRKKTKEKEKNPEIHNKGG